MDLQLFLALNVIAICGMMALIALLNRTPGALPWIGVNLGVAGLGLAALAWNWPWPGLIALALFVPLVVAPGTLMSFAQRRTQAGRYAEAARLSGWAARLHPAPNTRFFAAFTRALAMDDSAQQRQAFAALAERGTPQQKVMIATMQRALANDWEGIAQAIGQETHSFAALAPVQVHALCELGRLEEAVRLFAAAKGTLFAPDMNQCHLSLMAFAGRPQAVATLFSRTLAHLDPEVSRYWLAVAEAYAPATHATGREKLAELAVSASTARLRDRAARQGERAAPRDRASLSVLAQQVLDDAERRIGANAAQAAGFAAIPVTLALVAANLAAFAAEEILGSSEDLETLVNLGALWPPYVWDDGEWWRLLSAAFLHFGPAHLFANMFMLLVLGRMVEAMFGWQKMLLIYLVGAIGSCGAVLALMRLGYSEDHVLIGASGAVFALFGANAARVLVRWIRYRDVLERRQLINLSVVLAIQVMIDFSIPQISASAHISGLMIGLMLGVLLPARR